MNWIIFKLRWWRWFLWEHPRWLEDLSGENYRLAVKRWQEKAPSSVSH